MCCDLSVVINGMGRLQKITVPSHLFLLGAVVLLKFLFQSSTDLRLIHFHQKFQYVISGLFLCIRIVEAEIQHVFFRNRATTSNPSCVSPPLSILMKKDMKIVLLLSLRPKSFHVPIFCFPFSCHDNAE